MGYINNVYYLRYLPLLLLCGCYTIDVGERVSIIDHEYFSTAQDIVYLWQEDTTLPEYDCDIDKLYVAQPDDQTFREGSYGYYCPIRGEIEDCSIIAYAYFQDEDRIIRRKSAYIIVLSAHLTPEEEEGAIAHETLHWLSQCTGHDRTTPDGGYGYPFVNADSAHKDPRLWGADGVLSRAGF